MKTHLPYIALIVLICTAGYLTFNKQAARIDRLNGNVSALRQDTSEKAAVLVVTRKELRTLFVQKDSMIRAYEKKQGGKVREWHAMSYGVSSAVRDTVEVQTTCPDPEYQNDLPIQFYFPHGCVSSIVEYDPNNGVAQDSLFGEIEINRYVLAAKPRYRIFKPWYWNSKNWPVTDIRIENNCGLTIKENTILQLK